MDDSGSFPPRPPARATGASLADRTALEETFDSLPANAAGLGRGQREFPPVVDPGRQPA